MGNLLKAPMRYERFLKYLGPTGSPFILYKNKSEIAISLSDKMNFYSASWLYIRLDMEILTPL